MKMLSAMEKRKSQWGERIGNCRSWGWFAVLDKAVRDEMVTPKGD